MKRKRSVIITGAGAMIPWGAPFTNDLTQLLRNDKVFINEKGESIGDYLYSVLNKQIGKERRFSQPNFETILYFIEKIFEYKTSVYGMSPNFFRLNDFFDLKGEILDSLVIFEKTNPNFYANLGSPDKLFLNTAFKKNCLISNNDFYENLYLHFIFLIKEKIEEYEKNCDCQLNNLYNLFLESLKENNGIVRYYTLNYDCLPLKIANIKFFDGYNKDELRTFNQKKINEDNNVDCYYHLHGSFRLNLVGKISDDYEMTSIQRSYMKTDLIPTNIISGFNKLDRIFSNSYFHFYNKLVYDCYKSDQIFIIGYSFNDMHINAAIRSAVQKGKTKIICIDKCELSCFADKYYNVTPQGKYLIERPVLASNEIELITESEKTKIYLTGFENFLLKNFPETK